MPQITAATFENYTRAQPADEQPTDEQQPVDGQPTGGLVNVDGQPADTQKFTWIEGRGFMNTSNPKYILPQDTIECNRLNIQHYLLGFVLRSTLIEPLIDS